MSIHQIVAPLCLSLNCKKWLEVSLSILSTTHFSFSISQLRPPAVPATNLLELNEKNSFLALMNYGMSMSMIVT